jgi:hypothetical protein
LYPSNKLLSRRFLWFRIVHDVGMLYSPRVMSGEVNIMQLSPKYELDMTVCQP